MGRRPAKTSAGSSARASAAAAEPSSLAPPPAATVASNCGSGADSAGQFHPRKLFVGGLALKTTTGHLRDHFQRFGHVIDTVVLRWPDGRSRGFGYVTFAQATAAEAAMKQYHHELGGRQVDVKRAVPGTNKVFVGGLPQGAAASDLASHFGTFGTVSDAVVMMDSATGRSRGFGFVCFLPGPEGAVAVEEVLASYDNHRIKGKWIEVKSAAPPQKLSPSTSASSGPGSEAGTITPPVFSRTPEHGSLTPAAAVAAAAKAAGARAQRKDGHGPLQQRRAPARPSALKGQHELDVTLELPPPAQSSSLGSPRKVALPRGLLMDGAAPPPGAAGSAAPSSSSGFDAELGSASSIAPGAGAGGSSGSAGAVPSRGGSGGLCGLAGASAGSLSAALLALAAGSAPPGLASVGAMPGVPALSLDMATAPAAAALSFERAWALHAAAAAVASAAAGSTVPGAEAAGLAGVAGAGYLGASWAGCDFGGLGGLGASGYPTTGGFDDAMHPWFR